MDNKENIRVLLVDDEKDFVESTARALSRRGFETQTAGDGQEAIRLLEMVAFDVVLLDVKMPGVDGTEVFYAVKRRWPRTAIVMLTGHGTDQQSYELTRDGAAGYLAKPCEIEEIVATLTKAMDGARANASQDAEELPAEPRVLLVDDEPDFLRSVSPALRRRGMEVSTAGSGQEGLDVLSQAVIDVVVLDMKMPGMGGMEALQVIKKTYPLIEVVVLTGHPSLEAAVEVVKHGAYDFLMKPAEVEALTVKIREAYRRRTGKTTEEYKRRMEELMKWRRE
jgi:DNA-binding NtrC family response regulator